MFSLRYSTAILASAIIVNSLAGSLSWADFDTEIKQWAEQLPELTLDGQVQPCSCCDTCCDSCCDSCCGDGCDCGCGCGAGGGKLFGLFLASEPGFHDFISPMTNPVFFEDPRTLTEARFIYLRHEVPTAVGGGLVQLFALQLRAAITERLSIVAAKDGFATSSHPLIDDGWADLSVGLKYNLIADRGGSADPQHGICLRTANW